MSNLWCRADKYYSYKEGQHNTINLLFRFNSYIELVQKNLLSDEEIKIAVLHKYPKLSYHGIEDLRLINNYNSILGVGAAVVSDDLGLRTIQVLFTLDTDNLALLNPIIPNSPNEEVWSEKNWIPLVQDGKIYIIYSIDPFIIYELLGDKLVPSIETGGFIGDHKSIRIQGGTNLVFIDEEFIGIAHDYKYIADKIYYTHRFYKLNSNREIIELGDSFVIESRGIEFVTGLAIKDDKLYISYGLSDRAAKLIIMNISDLSKFLNQY
jgi:hypothetical protein